MEITKDIENLKEILELKSITEMKKKNNQREVKGRFEQTKERISKLEGETMDMTTAEKQEEKNSEEK